MKYILIISVFIFFNFSFAQKFKGSVYYQSKNSLNDFKISSEGMSDEQLKRINQTVSKAFEKTYILKFSGFESTFKEEVNLDPNAVNKNASSSADYDILYKNLKKKQYIKEFDFMGKFFLIKDSLPQYKWEILKDQKNIGTYKCTKAIITIPVTDVELKDYEDYKVKQDSSKTNFLVTEPPKPKIIEAWFANDLPISNGPLNYYGLPGLILELHEGSFTYLCTKIILNPVNRIEIKAPTKGKKVSQKEFEIIEKKKLDSMTNKDGVIEFRMN